MVGHQVAGDRDEPGAHVTALPGEGADPAQRAQEGLAGEVLGHLPAADPVADVAVDDVDVPVVELAEGLGVAGLGPLHQGQPDRGVTLGGRRQLGAHRDDVVAGGAGRRQAGVRRGLGAAHGRLLFGAGRASAGGPGRAHLV